MPRRRLRDLSIVQNTRNSEETNSEQQTAIGSLNVSETPDEPAEIQTKSGGSRRTPGRTLLKDLYELNPVERVKELSSGQKVERLQLFDITHRKKDRSPMTFEAGEIMDKLKDKKAEYKAISLSDSSVNLEDIDNRIIIEVLGPEKYGQVRFQGSGVNPTQYFGSSLQQYMPSGS
ncbi:Putative coatomer subunit alpha [Gossypium arboreum]|uniref:Putative coatomer subunit alpha n=1 Tax=Gossypium arboreum TaxID=29729 RepID=A0A0B0NAV2_GOSAR|nr:Putative coatomer subunit alpha [Gossypium arboreum]